MSSAATGAGSPAAWAGQVPGGRAAGAAVPGPGGQAGQGVPPGGDAAAGQHAEPERERLGACVQGGMTQLLVAGIQPAAGNGDPGRHPGGRPVQQPRGQVR